MRAPDLSEDAWELTETIFPPFTTTVAWYRGAISGDV
jgi:hypothetical protein